MRFFGYFFVLSQDALHSLDPIHTTHVRRGQFLLNPREPILGGVVNTGDDLFSYEADEVGSASCGACHSCSSSWYARGGRGARPTQTADTSYTEVTAGRELPGNHPAAPSFVGAPASSAGVWQRCRKLALSD